MVMMAMSDEYTSHIGVIGKDAFYGIEITDVNKVIVFANAVGKGIDYGIHDRSDGCFYHKH